MLYVFQLGVNFDFRSSLLDGTSVFESTVSADPDSLFSDSLGNAREQVYRGRLPGRLSSSSIGAPSESIRSVSSVFPRPDLSGCPVSGSRPNTH